MVEASALARAALAPAAAPKRVHPVVQPTTMRASYADEPVRLDAPAGASRRTGSSA